MEMEQVGGVLVHPVVSNTFGYEYDVDGTTSERSSRCCR
jgi:hypothetical protein